MPLNLIHGPPNSGRAGRIRRGLIAVLDRDPVLVVPTLDDVYRFERELCAEGAVLGADGDDLRRPLRHGGDGRRRAARRRA